MKVFITGSTGLLGSNIVQELLRKNHQVTGLVRSSDRGRQLLNPEVELVEGHMLNVDQFADKLDGMDVLIHTAAYYTEYHRNGNKELPHEINVKGTISLLEAAHQQGIKNVVYISSSGVLTSNAGRPTDESSPYAEEGEDFYFQSKVDAEKEIFRFMDSHPNLRIVLILPSVMLGPGDSGPTPTGNMVKKFLEGEIKFILPGSLCIVDARDVALAVIESIEKGESGERYVIGGRKYELESFFKVLAEVTGAPPLTKKPSPRVLMLVAKTMSLISKVTGKPPLLKPSILKRLQEDFWYDSKKAERELGVRFRPLTETLSDTANWFRSQI